MGALIKRFFREGEGGNDKKQILIKTLNTKGPEIHDNIRIVFLGGGGININSRNLFRKKFNPSMWISSKHHPVKALFIKNKYENFFQLEVRSSIKT